MSEDLRSKITRRFTAENRQRLRAALRRIGEALPICDDAEACGVNVAGMRQAYLEMKSNLEEIEARFMDQSEAVLNDG